MPEVEKYTPKDIEKMVQNMYPQLGGKLAEVTEALKKEFGDFLSDLASRILQGIIVLLVWSGKVLGEGFGEFAIGKELGERVARQRERPTLLDPATLIELFRRREVPEVDAHEEMTLQGFSEERAYLFRKLSETLPYSTDILRSFLLHNITADEARERLSKLGFTEESQTILISNTERLLDPDSLLRLWLRDAIDSQTVHRELSRHGYPEEAIERLKVLAYYIPPVPDLVRMAVREAFTPEIAERFGQYEDFPVDFEKYAAQQGVHPDWAKAYWAAHWDLPSPLMGFEMLHRAIISQEELELLLRALDIMPFWRERLIKLSYTPLTRVDIRRMYQLGVVDLVEVKRAYMDIGYSEENADRMTRFTEALYLEEEKGLTKAEVLKSFRENMVSPQETREALQSLGYSDEAIELLISLEEWKREKEIRDKRIAVIRKRYLTNNIEDGEMVRQLVSLALSGTEVDYYSEMWRAEKSADTVSLSLPDLRRALKGGIVSRDEFRTRVRRLGYNDHDIDLLIEIERKGG